jgi:hypothetical protein
MPCMGQTAAALGEILHCSTARIFASIVLMLVMGAAHGQLHRCTGGDGRVQLTDRPCDGGGVPRQEQKAAENTPPQAMARRCTYSDGTVSHRVTACPRNVTTANCVVQSTGAPCLAQSGLLRDEPIPRQQACSEAAPRLRSIQSNARAASMREGAEQRLRELCS